MYTYLHTLPVDETRPLSSSEKADFINNIMQANVDYSKSIDTDGLRLVLGRLAIDTPDGYNNHIANIDGERIDSRGLSLARAKAVEAGDLDRYVSLNADALLGVGESFIAGKLINPKDQSPAWFLAKIVKSVDHSGIEQTKYVMLITIDLHHTTVNGDVKMFDIKIDHSLINITLSKTRVDQMNHRLVCKTVGALGHVLPTTLVNLLAHQ